MVKTKKTQAELTVEECRAALAENRLVGDGAARVIASDWHGGQASQLYSFASTGAVVDCQGLRTEIQRELKDRLTDSEEFLVLEALLSYVEHHEGRERVEGWSSLWVE